MHDGARPIVVVLGMHRSGTSLCSHILSIMGVDMVTEVRPAIDNPNGHWERWDIVALHDRLLDHFNRSYFGPYHDFPLPTAWWADPFVRQVENEFVELISGQLANVDVFGFKDPRTAKFIPMWNRIFRRLNLRPHYVLCIRNFADIGRSLEAREGLPRSVGELRSLLYVADILNSIVQAPSCIVRYETWFSDPAENMNALLEAVPGRPFLPPDLMMSTIQKIIDPALNHGSRQGRSFSNALVESCYNQIDMALETGSRMDDLSMLLRRIDWLRDGLADVVEVILKPFEAERGVFAQGQARVVDLEASLTAVQRHVQYLQDEVQELQAARSSKDAELVELRSALDVALAEAQREASDKAAIHRACEAEQAARSAADQQLHVSKEALQLAEARIQDHLGRIAQLEDAYHDFTARLHAAEATLTERDGALAHLQGVMSELSARADQAEAALRAREGELESERAAKVAAEARASELAASLQGKTSALLDAEQLLAQGVSGQVLRKLSKLVRSSP